MFKLMKLDDGVENLLANPTMQTWMSFVKKMNMQKPENKVSILETLLKNFDEATVAKMIEHASRYVSTESLATSLKKELLLKWSSANEPPAKLLNVLKLDKEASSLASNPALVTLTEYVNIWNRNNPKRKTSLMNTIMTSTKYDDATVARALEAAKKVKGSETRALELQGLQFDRWMDFGLSPKKISNGVFGSKPTAEEASIMKQYAAYYKDQKDVLRKIENAS